MKNILFVYAEIVVEEHSNCYYHNFLQSIIDRYKQFGNLTICVSRRKVDAPTMNKLDLSDITIKFIEKENTFRKRFISTAPNRQILKEEILKTDKIIAHFPSSVSDYSVRMAHQSSKSILGVVLGCVWDAFYNYNFKGKLLAPLAYFQMKKAVRNCDRLIYVSNIFLQRRYPTKHPALGCSDVEISSHTKSEISEIVERRRLIFGDGIDCLTIATVGALVSYKNHDVVFKAMAILKGQIKIRYEIIGGGNTDRLRILSEQLGINDSVHFTGQIPHNDIVHKLSEIDLYIQPSKLEGMPRALIEAMNEGCPAIGSRVGGIPELLEENELFDPNDFRKIADILLSLTPESLKEMSARNLKKTLSFDSTILDKKRNEFLDNFMKE